MRGGAKACLGEGRGGGERAGDDGGAGNDARDGRAGWSVSVVPHGVWVFQSAYSQGVEGLSEGAVFPLRRHVDSPKVIMTTAEKRGVMCTGYHANQAALAPKGYLTGAEWNWSKIYSDYAQWVHDGKSLMAGTIPHLIRGGLKDGFCTVSTYG